MLVFGRSENLLNRKLISRLTLLAAILILTSSVWPQSQKDQARTKTFGKSLKEDRHRPEPAPQPSATPSDDTIRVETNLVISDVLVLNQKGNAILGLEKDDFTVTDNGVPQTLELFSNGTGKPVPRSIILIMDYSGSQDPYFLGSVAAAKVLVEKLGPEDKMAVVTDDVKLLTDFTSDKNELKHVLDSLAKDFKYGKRGKSDQYSALLATLKELVDDEDLRPTIIFQTDGDEGLWFKGADYSKWSKVVPKGHAHERSFDFADIKNAVESSRATLYSVIPGVRFVGLTSEQLADAGKTYLDNLSASMRTRPKKYSQNEVDLAIEKESLDQGRLAELAFLSGGYTEFLEHPQDADEAYSQIFKVMDNRYFIGFYPTERGIDKKRRSVRIEIKGHPEFTIIGRKTYIPR